MVVLELVRLLHLFIFVFQIFATFNKMSLKTNAYSFMRRSLQ